VRVNLNYVPQHKQARLHESPANEILYGGAAGPGKSHALRFEALIWAMRIPNLQVYLFRRTYPELEKNHILPSRFQFPSELGEYKTGDRRWEFKNGSMIHFCHCQYDSDVFNYQGAEIDLLLIDELTTFTEFQYDYLRGRVRPTMDIPEHYRHKIPGIVCASNPGGVGHQFAKLRWVTFIGKAGGIRQAPGREGGMLRQYIPGRLEDNPILLERDPEYIHRLDALPEPYRTAYKEGDWDIFLGQMFNFTAMHHVVKPRPIPEHAPLYFTFDWGYGAPFECLWHWIDADNRIYTFGEEYGWNGTENQGLRITDSQIAERILQKEKQLDIDPNRYIQRLSGPDCFNKKPDYKGGGQGPSTAEVFSQHKIYMSPGDPSRILKIRQVHERLRLFDDMAPMLQVYEGCKHLIRTLPDLQADDHNVEDVDTNGEDHCFSGDTLVDTNIGQVPIQSLVGKQGMVLTAGGYWTRFHDCRKTRQKSELLNIGFADGRSIKCTPDHKFLTHEGSWVTAKHLTIDEECCMSISNDNLLSEDILCKLTSLMTLRKRSMGSGTGFVDNITNVRDSDYTGLYGNFIMDQYQKVLQSITLITIEAIIRLKTLHYSKVASMCRIMLNSLTIPHGLSLCVQGPQDGMEAQRDWHGIKNTIERTVLNPYIKNDLRKYVTAVEPSLWGCPIQNTVQENVRLKIGMSEIWSKLRQFVKYVATSSTQMEDNSSDLVQNLVRRGSHGKSVRIKRIDVAQSSNVYCLIADATHAFTVCGGIVVHNCYDALALMCMARPMSLVEPKPRKSEHDRRIDWLEKTDKGTYTDYAFRVHQEALGMLGVGQVDYGDMDEYEDRGEMVGTVN